MKKSKISNIEIIPVNTRKGCVAFASVVYDGALLLSNMALIGGAEGLTVRYFAKFVEVERNSEKECFNKFNTQKRFFVKGKKYKSSPFATEDQAEAKLKQLKDEGWDVSKLKIVEGITEMKRFDVWHPINKETAGEIEKAVIDKANKILNL